MKHGEENQRTESQKKSLTFADRLLFASILPANASFRDAMVIAELKDKVKVSSDDLQRAKTISLPSGGIQWDDEAAKQIPDLEIEFNTLAISIIRENLKKMDDEKRIPAEPHYIRLYRLFMN